MKPLYFCHFPQLFVPRFKHSFVARTSNCGIMLNNYVKKENKNINIRGTYVS